MIRGLIRVTTVGSDTAAQAACFHSLMSGWIRPRQPAVTSCCALSKWTSLPLSQILPRAHTAFSDTSSRANSLLGYNLKVLWNGLCVIESWYFHFRWMKSSVYYRGRNNSRISGSQQDYLVGKSGSPQIYLVVIWPRFKQNNMTNTTLEKYSQILW